MAVVPFPVPAASHAACGFTALRAPAPFTSRVMRPLSSLRRDAYSRRLRSCTVLGGFINPPLPSVLTPTSVQQGSFAPRALPRFVATTNLAAAVSSSADFPGLPVIRPTWLRRFSRRDEDGFSSCSTCPCHRAAPTTPPECFAAAISLRRSMLPSPRSSGLGLRSLFFVEAPCGFTCVAAR